MDPTTEIALMQGMTDSQRLLFSSEMNGVRKNATTGVLLALLLGGLGAHRFYLGQVGLGILYALLCWTLIPAIVALIECFLMSGRVARYNQAQAMNIAAKVKMLGSPGATPVQA